MQGLMDFMGAPESTGAILTFPPPLAYQAATPSSNACAAARARRLPWGGHRHPRADA
jgi:hypothetical protein